MEQISYVFDLMRKTHIRVRIGVVSSTLNPKEDREFGVWGSI